MILATYWNRKDHLQSCISVLKWFGKTLWYKYNTNIKLRGYKYTGLIVEIQHLYSTGIICCDFLTGVKFGNKRHVSSQSLTTRIVKHTVSGNELSK